MSPAGPSRPDARRELVRARRAGVAGPGRPPGRAADAAEDRRLLHPFRVAPDAEPAGAQDPAGLATLVPGRIRTWRRAGTSASRRRPVQGYGEFTRSVLLSVAAGMGISTRR